MPPKKKKKKAVKKRVVPKKEKDSNGTKSTTNKQKDKPPKVIPHPTAGKKILVFENELQSQLKQADESDQDRPLPEKRGRGRPRKIPAGPEVTSAPELPQDIIKNAIKVPFDLWAIQQSITELRLGDNEAAALAEPVKQLLDYYSPQLPAVSIAWFSLAVVSYSILAVRLRIIDKQKKNQVSPPAKGPAGQGGRQAQAVSGPGDSFPTEIKTDDQKE